MVEEHTAMDEEMARKGRDEDFEVRDRLARKPWPKSVTLASAAHGVPWKILGEAMSGGSRALRLRGVKGS
jgi:hypothetical protein